MIKNLSVEKLLKSDLLVKENVDDVNEAITRLSARKIILAGSRGSGRSIVLKSREIESAGTSSPAILTRFDASSIFGKKDDVILNKTLMTHYYECLMSKQILNYIRDNYPEIFERDFLDLDNKVHRRILETSEYMNKDYLKNMAVPRMYIIGEVSSEVLSKFRKAAGADSVTLMIDRFDWTHNSDPRVQEVLKKYFDMFEQVIITSDDPKANTRKGVAALIDSGYEVMDAWYGKDPEVVKEIVRRRFAYDTTGQVGSKIFPIDVVQRITRWRNSFNRRKFIRCCNW